MKKLLFIAVVVVGASALVLAGRAGGFGQRGFANGPGWNYPGAEGFGQQGFAKGPGWMHQGPGGRGQFGPLGNLQDAGAPPMMLGVLDLTDEQKEVITALVEESRKKLHADIEAVLTPGQVEKLEKLRDDGTARGFAALDLTEEQQTAIAEIRENARADAEAAETPEARCEIMQTAHEEVKSVLTDEQIDKLEQLRPRTPWGPGRGRVGIGPRGPYAGPDGPLAALDLTDEQKTAIEAIREQARTDAEAAETRQARQEIMQTAHEEVLSVLTDEQVEKLEQWRAKTRNGRIGRGRW